MQTIEPKWSPDSKYIVARFNNMARVYKVELDNVILEVDLEHKSKVKYFYQSNEVWDIQFSPDGKYLAVGFCKFEIQLWEF